MSGGGIAVGGGGIGLIIAIVIVVVNAFGGDALGAGGSLGRDGRGRAGERATCSTVRRAPTRRTRGLPDRRVRQQHPGLLGRPGAEVPGGTDRVLHRIRPRAGAVRRPPPSAPSTARPTRKVYIDLGFFQELDGSLRCAGRPAGRGVRAGARVRASHAGPPRSVRSRAAAAGRDRRAIPSAPSFRPIVTRACGRRTPSTPDT